MSESDNLNETSATDEHEQCADPVGRVEWLDLTVPDAPGLRDFYRAVVGWKSEDVDMGIYNDFNMQLPESGTTVAGICHARGPNGQMPPQWLVYVRVESVANSAAACEQRGGKILDGPRRMGGSHFCVIQDPAGAVMALLSDQN